VGYGKEGFGGRWKGGGEGLKGGYILRLLFCKFSSKFQPVCQINKTGRHRKRVKKILVGENSKGY
jgi:hypothetical protein